MCMTNKYLGGWGKDKQESESGVDSLDSGPALYLWPGWWFFRDKGQAVKTKKPKVPIPHYHVEGSSSAPKSQLA